MTCSKWRQNGLPHKGWICTDVYELDSYSNCEWCGTEIVYVHVLTHPETNVTTEAGCICAEHLTQDYVTPRKQENRLRKRCAKRSRWVKSAKWKVTPKGNWYRKDAQVLIFSTDNGYKVKIGKIWGKRNYEFVRHAKQAAFEYLYKKW